jgi:hypothetical protein
MNMYYKVPKVTTKRKSNIPPPDWNSDVSDLNKYKLSSTDIVSMNDLII